MTRHAREAISLAGATAIGEAALLALMTTDWSNVGGQVLLFAFLIGPPAFLGMLAWRRRDHAARTRVLFVTAGLVALGGFSVLGFDYYRFSTDAQFRKTPNMNCVLVPIGQWAAVGAVWVWLVIVEAREKRAARQAGQAPQPSNPSNPQQSA